MYVKWAFGGFVALFAGYYLSELSLPVFSARGKGQPGVLMTDKFEKVVSAHLHPKLMSAHLGDMIERKSWAHRRRAVLTLPEKQISLAESKKDLDINELLQKCYVPEAVKTRITSDQAERAVQSKTERDTCYRPWGATVIADAIDRKVVYVGLFGQIEYAEKVEQGTTGALFCKFNYKTDQTDYPCLHPDYRSTGDKSILDMLWEKQVPFYNPSVTIRLDDEVNLVHWNEQMRREEEQALAGCQVTLIYLDNKKAHVNLFQSFRKLMAIQKKAAKHKEAIVAFWGSSPDKTPREFEVVFWDVDSKIMKIDVKEGIPIEEREALRMERELTKLQAEAKEQGQEELLSDFAPAITRLRDKFRGSPREAAVAKEENPDPKDIEAWILDLWKATHEIRQTLHKLCEQLSQKDSADFLYLPIAGSRRPSEQEVFDQILKGYNFVKPKSKAGKSEKSNAAFVMPSIALFAMLLLGLEISISTKD